MQKLFTKSIRLSNCKGNSLKTKPAVKRWFLCFKEVLSSGGSQLRLHTINKTLPIQFAGLDHLITESSNTRPGMQVTGGREKFRNYELEKANCLLQKENFLNFNYEKENQ